MKKLILIILISITFGTNPIAQTINYADAVMAAENKIILLGKNHSHSFMGDVNIFKGQTNQPLFFVFELKPSGYMVVTSRKELPPVIAYSFRNNFIDDNNIQNPLKDLLIADIEARITSIDIMHKKTIEKRKLEWENLLSGVDNKNMMFQQWPDEGTTSTGGWLETNWTQNSPYKIFCPIDPVTLQRSYVGCPATAMAQIVNYYETVNSTEFTDDDDYYHSYAGRNFWIDDDHEEHDFLSFPEINDYLDSIATKYEDGSQLTNNEKAALSFTCGVAANQVYTSVGSGTFGVDQAFDAYMKFGFTEALLMSDSDTNLYNVMSQNMIEARPVHLAVVDESWTSGHNVVVDGYNTDDYYHVNFGWGGSNNGWYLLPEEMPYDLTVIEGAIVDIAYPQITGIFNKPTDNNLNICIYPNPATDFIRVELELNGTEKVYVSVMDIFGRPIYKAEQNTIAIQNKNEFYLDLNTFSGVKLTNGTYLLKVENAGNYATVKFVVR